MIEIALIIFYILALLLLASSHRTVEPSLKKLIKVFSYTILVAETILIYQYKYIDNVSLVLGVSFSAISLFISTYTLEYIKIQHYPNVLEPLMDFFLLSIITTYIAPSLVILATSWTIGEIIGYMLVKLGEEHSIEGSLTSSRGFIFTSTLTYELSVFTMIALSIVFTSANVGLRTLLEPFTTGEARITASPYIIPLLFLGFIVKTANIPLHFWLPSAHSSAPSPASAALSGLMVSLGYYGLLRILQYVDASSLIYPITWFFTVVGLLSILYGGLQAIQQRDAKKLLAYSTIATDGFISLLFAHYIAFPSPTKLWTLILGILMHAAYKTTLFSEAGLIEAVYGTRYIHGLRGFTATAPLSTLGGLMAVFTLVGVPGTIGFIVKIFSIFNCIAIYSEDHVISLTLLLGITLYIALSAIVGLKYAQIYIGGKPLKIPSLIESPDNAIQLPITALGSLNIVFNLALPLLQPTEVSYVFSSSSLISLLALFTIYMNFKAATRGVAPR